MTLFISPKSFCSFINRTSVKIWRNYSLERLLEMWLPQIAGGKEQIFFWRSLISPPFERPSLMSLQVSCAECPVSLCPCRLAWVLREPLGWEPRLLGHPVGSLSGELLYLPMALWPWARCHSWRSRLPAALGRLCGSVSRAGTAQAPCAGRGCSPGCRCVPGPPCASCKALPCPLGLGGSCPAAGGAGDLERSRLERWDKSGREGVNLHVEAA